MYDLTDMTQVKFILERHGFKFSKSLGQNFIIDKTVCPRIAEMGLDEKDMGVLEIGTGIGTLTSELAKRAKKVVSLEVDKKLYPIIDETLAPFSNIKCLHQDILKTDINKLCEEEFKDMKVCVCANLPYYITTPVIMYLLRSNVRWKNITVMIQKEVADRICAQIGSKNAGAITLGVRYYGKAEKCFDVKSGCFLPPPKVDSSVIKINMEDNLKSKVSDAEKYMKVVKAGFSQRRKSFVNSYTATTGAQKPDVIVALKRSGISENARIESIKLDDFINLVENL